VWKYSRSLEDGKLFVLCAACGDLAAFAVKIFNRKGRKGTRKAGKGSDVLSEIELCDHRLQDRG
jgi:hypothetical protein